MAILGKEAGEAEHVLGGAVRRRSIEFFLEIIGKAFDADESVFPRESFRSVGVNPDQFDRGKIGGIEIGRGIDSVVVRLEAGFRPAKAKKRSSKKRLRAGTKRSIAVTVGGAAIGADGTTALQEQFRGQQFFFYDMADPKLNEGRSISRDLTPREFKPRELVRPFF